MYLSQVAANSGLDKLIVLQDILDEALIKFEVSKALEDLLERGLADAVVLQRVLLLEFLYLAEDEANGPVFSVDSEPHVVAILLDDLDELKQSAKVLNSVVEDFLDDDVPGKVIHGEALDELFLHAGILLLAV